MKYVGPLPASNQNKTMSRPEAERKWHSLGLAAFWSFEHLSSPWTFTPPGSEGLDSCDYFLKKSGLQPRTHGVARLPPYSKIQDPSFVRSYKSRRPERTRLERARFEDQRNPVLLQNFLVGFSIQLFFSPFVLARCFLFGDRAAAPVAGRFPGAFLRHLLVKSAIRRVRIFAVRCDLVFVRCVSFFSVPLRTVVVTTLLSQG